MSRKFAVFDLDGTLMRWQVMHAAFYEMGKRGQLPADAHEEIRTALRRWKSRPHEEAYRDYELTWIKVIEGVLHELDPAALQEASIAAFERHKDQTYRYTRDLIAQLKQQGYALFAISGSHDMVVEKIADFYGFDDFIATQYVHTDGKFTGEVVLPMRDKATALKQLMTKHKLSLDGSIAIGDSESDIAMLEMVENPIAFNPTKKFFAHARSAGWKVVVERKNMIYELESKQGDYVLTNV